MKKTFIALFVAGAFFAASATGEETPRPTARTLVKEGVRLHDEGRFDDAIARYKRALELEPEDSEAHYELANTYLASGRYALCEETARRGLRKPGRLEGPLYGMIASCLSSDGKPDQALKVFKEGLAKHPDDVTLNFNIAVTLATQGKAQEAIPHLEKVIAARPLYGSPYFLSGEIFANQDRPVEGLFFFMRFVSLDPDSKRAPYAAAKVFELLTSGIEETKEGVNVTVRPLEKNLDILAQIEFSRSIAATTVHLKENQSQSKAQRYVSALDTFVKIVEETAQGEDGGPLAGTFLWERAAGPVIQLQRRGALECFGYALAARAGFAGAEEWLKSNPQKQRELEAALADLAP